MQYEPVIGLEVHLQLSTDTKAFCGCSTKFGERPNSQTCPVCLGLPGVLPVLNEKAFRYAVKVALALDCAIQKEAKFDRKNYYYPDLPKNFQISQYDKPLAYNGFVAINSTGDPLATGHSPTFIYAIHRSVSRCANHGRASRRVKMIRIKRVHLEEDAGKLIHEEGGDYSFVDYNRSGIPLLEIVTEPDLASPQEAYDYLVKLKAVLQYLEVSSCDMEKGSLRCDANISVRPKGTSSLGPKVELKNMNTFKGVRDALEYEVSRQLELANKGEETSQETRLWNAEKKATAPMRSKEEAHDYRYFPEPDLVPFIVEKSVIDTIKATLPELPEARGERLKEKFGLSEYDAGVLISDKDTADYFEECSKYYDKPKTLVNWIMGDIASQIREKRVGIKELAPPPKDIAELLELVDSGKISGKIAKDVLFEMMETKRPARDIVSSKGISQISDRHLLESVVKTVLEKNKKSLEDYRAGKENAFTYLVGQIMKETKGRANPELANEILRKTLKGRFHF